MGMALAFNTKVATKPLMVESALLSNIAGKSDLNLSREGGDSTGNALTGECLS